MTSVASFDLSVLPDSSLDAREPLWWGQLIMASIEGTLFVILAICYLYYRSKFNIWPPPGVHQPFALATANTVLLLASCFPVYLADKAVQKKDRSRVIFWEIAVLLVGLLFIGLRIAECRTLNYKWNSHEFGSIVWAILWLHSYDFGAALLEEVVLIAIFLSGRVGDKQRLGIRVSTILYYFLAAIWVPQYILVYVYPYLLQR